MMCVLCLAGVLWLCVLFSVFVWGWEWGVRSSCCWDVCVVVCLFVYFLGGEWGSCSLSFFLFFWGGGDEGVRTRKGWSEMGVWVGGIFCCWFTRCCCCCFGCVCVVVFFLGGEGLCFFVFLGGVGGGRTRKGESEMGVWAFCTAGKRTSNSLMHN